MPRLIFVLSGVVAFAAAIVLGARQKRRDRAAKASESPATRLDRTDPKP
jgi:hypothetical protein